MTQWQLISHPEQEKNKQLINSWITYKSYFCSKFWFVWVLLSALAPISNLQWQELQKFKHILLTFTPRWWLKCKGSNHTGWRGTRTRAREHKLQAWIYYLIHSGKLLVRRNPERVEEVGSHPNLDRDRARAFYFLNRVEGHGKSNLRRRFEKQSKHYPPTIFT